MENPTAKIVEGSDGLLLEIDGQIVPNYDATMRPFEEGEVVTGHVVRIDHDEVLVDIGYKSEGVIPANELSIRKAVDPHDEVTIGEEVDALVLTKEDQDGRLIMSKKRARFEKAWRRIEAAAESGEPVEGTVIEVVKGGLIIDLGVRGFLPASLVDIRRVPNLDEYMGTQIECKVIELNRSRNNVVLSRRAVLEEERKEVRQQILDRLAPGLVVEGQISNIVDFGAFVDLDGIDGLIHISELSWSHVNHPSEVLEIGDTVQVKVLDIDRDRQRISLGLKQTQEDPWQRIVNTYNIGDELAGTVTKVVTFGAFVEILDGVEGLVHISELAAHHVENPREIVQPGDELRVKILEIDSERRRLSLSAKRVEGQVLPVRRIEPEQPSEAADAQPAADGDAEPAPDATADEAPQAEAELAEAAQPAADEAGGATEALDEIEPAAEVVQEPVVVAPEPVAVAEVAEVAEETVTADEPEAVIEAPTQDADTPASPQAAESTGPQVVEQPGGDDDAAEQQPSAAE
jgi:small subunit ribosomal protein S1